MTKYPSLPQTIQDITFGGDWTRTIQGEDMLLADSGENDPERIIIFATKKDLEILCNSNCIYLDGTFKSCPDLFYQLFTLHAFVEGKQFPFVYVLLPGKTRILYDRMFHMLKEACWNCNFQMNPKKIMSDFESSLIPSIAIQFPGSKHKGCFYHFSQAIWRKVQSLGYQTEYLHNDQIRVFIREMMALAFIPEWEVSIGFQSLCTDTPEDLNVGEFTDYMDRTWINGTFKPELWNVFDSNGPHTNNHLEGWHNRLNSFLGRRHPNIYQLMEFITKEQAVIDIEILQLQSGALAPPKMYIALECRIENLQQKYMSGELDMDEYLLRIANNLGNR